MTEHLNPEFSIPLSTIEEKLGMHVNGELKAHDLVIPLRSLTKVSHAQLFNTAVFEGLLRNIPLRGTSEKPYAHSEIRVFRREPIGMDVGQTFVLKEKLLALIEALQRNFFAEIFTGGLSRMNPMIFYGEDSQCRKALSFYIPPLIEIHKNRAVLLDGMHRNYIIKSAGTEVNAVHISNVSVALPFEPIAWSQVSMVEKRPEISKRYHALQTQYFRDLTAIGIDG